MINRLAIFIDAATLELAEANEKLTLMAVTDSLTNLFNRSEIQRRITENIDEGKNGCLIMLDIDNFKQVNDTYGHQEGDNVIMGLSFVMRKTSDDAGYSGLNAHGFALSKYSGQRYSNSEMEKMKLRFGSDILTTQSPMGRWGGEEFMILLPERSLEESVAFAEKIRKAFYDITFELAGHRSVSIGVTEIKKGESADDVYVRVDRALYEAKNAGKNRVIVL